MLPDLVAEAYAGSGGIYLFTIIIGVILAIGGYVYRDNRCFINDIGENGVHSLHHAPGSCRRDLRRIRRNLPLHYHHRRYLGNQSAAGEAAVHVVLKILAESSGGNSGVQEKALEALESLVAGHFVLQMTLHDFMSLSENRGAFLYLLNSTFWKKDICNLKSYFQRLDDWSNLEESDLSTDDCPSVAPRITRQIGRTCSYYAAVRSFNHR